MRKSRAVLCFDKEEIMILRYAMQKYLKDEKDRIRKIKHNAVLEDEMFEKAFREAYDIELAVNEKLNIAYAKIES